VRDPVSVLLGVVKYSNLEEAPKVFVAHAAILIFDVSVLKS
jgi:hypothetical protein